MDAMFSNPFYHALRTEHTHLAIGSSVTLRYPADVIPFAAIAQPTQEAMLALSHLIDPGEIFYMTGDGLSGLPFVERTLQHVKKLPGWQYHFRPEKLPDPATGPDIRVLTADDAPAMVALTDAAFPGYFRPRTYLLGNYYGIHIDGQLIAMAGERVALPGYREISAICTHPSHTGQGHAAALTRHILRAHANAGLRSFLHVLAANHRAISLYERLGFTRTIPMMFNQFRKPCTQS